MITYTCDHCKQPIAEVMWIVQARGVESPYVGREYHLHFKCVIPFWKGQDG